MNKEDTIGSIVTGILYFATGNEIYVIIMILQQITRPKHF